MKREFLVKLNREFESNLLRRPVSLFLSLGAVLLEKCSSAQFDFTQLGVQINTAPPEGIPERNNP